MSGSTDKYRTRQGKVRWRARWDLPLSPDGSRRRQTKNGFATKGEADRFLRETLRLQDYGGRINPSDERLGEYLTRWLAGKRIRPTTRDNYATCIEIHTNPRIGGMRLADITHHTLNALYRDLEEHGKAARQDPEQGIVDTCRTAGITCAQHGCAPQRHDGLSVRSVQHVHGTLRSALQDAVRDGLILRNAADLATPPRRTAGQRRVTRQQVWSGDEAKRFLDSVRNDALEPLWTLALATGLRRGELVGLTWPAIDFSNATLEVRRSTTTVRGTDVDSTGKTDAARRRLSLDPHLVNLLERHRRNQAALGIRAPDQQVFTDENAAALRPQRLTTSLRRLAAEADLPNIGVHGLRHTAATLMLNNGVPLHIVANRLGHSDASTTLSVYAHVMPNDDKIAAGALAAVLFDQRTEPSTPTSAEPKGPTRADTATRPTRSRPLPPPPPRRDPRNRRPRLEF